MGTNNFISKVTPLGSATTYTVKDPIMQETIIGTQTGQTGSWTGKSNYINALYDGLTIRYYLPYAPSGNATLNLTLADGTTTGAINCYYGNTTRLTTHYSAGNVIEMTYFSAGSISIAGTATTDNRWIAKANYADGNDVNVSRITYPRLKTGAVGIGRYTLFMEASDGTYQSLTSTFNSTGTSHVKNTAKFKLGRIYYRNRSDDLAANNSSDTNNSWMDQQTSLVDLRYSTNCGTTLVARKPIYIVGTIGTDGYFTLADTWYSQTEPTSEDGKVYIYLGMVYNDTNPYRVAFEVENPVYWYKNSGFRLYGSGRGISNITRSGTTFTATRDDGSTFTFSQQDNNSDINVKQLAAIDTNGAYPIILGNTTATTEVTGTVNKTSTLTYNPSTKALSISGGSVSATSMTATTFNGALAGNASSATKATQDGSGNNIVNTYLTKAAGVTAVSWDSTNKKITRTINGSAADVVQFAAGGATSLTGASGKLTISSTDQNVSQTNQTGSNDYRVLLSGSANDTTETTGTNKNTNLRFNPGTQTLSVGGSITATGDLDITGNTTLSGQTSADSLTAGSLLVNGAASFVQSPTAPTPADSSNDTTVATTAFVKNAFTANDAMVFKGTIGSSGATVTALPATHKQGWTYKVITAGSYAGQQCEIGDTIYCITDGTSANNDHWTVVQTNIDGAVIGPASSTSGNLAIFNGTTGKLIADSGKTISTATATSSSTDSTVPTTKAVWSTIAALDGTISGTAGAGKTLTAFSQTDGKVSATFGNISITKSQISDFPSTMTPSSHTHGNITNDGKIGSTADYAVYTTTGGTVTAGSFAVTSPSASGTTTSFIDTVSQDSKGKISATKKTVTSATTSTAGIMAMSKANLNTMINQLDTGTSTPVDADYYISQYVSGGSTTTTYHRRPMSALYEYVKGKLNVTNNNINLSRNTETTIATIGGTAIKIKLPASDNTDTKNTAGSNDSASKLFLIGATAQSANPQTYSNSAVYAQAGAFAATSVKVAEKVTLQYNNTANTLDFIFV